MIECFPVVPVANLQLARIVAKNLRTMTAPLCAVRKERLYYLLLIAN